MALTLPVIIHVIKYRIQKAFHIGLVIHDNGYLINPLFAVILEKLAR